MPAYERIIAGDSGSLYKDRRYYYNATGLLEYKCLNRYSVIASTASTDWEVWKYTYDGDGLMTRCQGPLIGSVDNRASLSWS
jgi:hypothetical protein